MKFLAWAYDAERAQCDMLAPLPPEIVERRDRNRALILNGGLLYLTLSLTPVILIR